MADLVKARIVSQARHPERKAKTKGDHGTSVKVPVPVPEGVKFKTTVKDDDK